MEERLYKIGDLVNECEGQRKAGVIIRIRSEYIYFKGTHYEVLWPGGTKLTHKESYIEPCESNK